MYFRELNYGNLLPGDAENIVHKARCFNVLHLLLKVWKIPGELLAFNATWETEESGSENSK